MDCSLTGSSVHRILQARILEWVAFPSPGNLSDPGIEPGSPELQELIVYRLSYQESPQFIKNIAFKKLRHTSHNIKFTTL